MREEGSKILDIERGSSASAGAEWLSSRATHVERSICQTKLDVDVKVDEWRRSFCKSCRKTYLEGI